jgi:hypothetical protein
MNKEILLLALLLSPFLGGAQELFHLSFEHRQSSIYSAWDDTNETSFPLKESTIIIGGLNDLDGIGNYFNIFGSKLIVDSLDIASDGTQRVVLRREDGDNFFNLYPSIKAKLTPVRYLKNNKIQPINTKP